MSWDAVEDGSGSESEHEEEGMNGGGFPLAGVEDFGSDEPATSAWKKKKEKKAKSGGFESLGLSNEIFRGVKRKGYRVPTPIQRKTLPLIMAGHDVVAMARTGSGKTAAFLLPMLERLKVHSPKAGARAVILAPTRELALQTFKFCKELGRYTNLRAAVLVGGDSMEAQFEALAHNPDILVATPGRLMHHLAEVEGMSLRSVEYVVFDEADRLFEMGFAEQLRSILSHMAETRQTLLFSATLPKVLAEFARAGLKEPQLIRLDADMKMSKDLRLEFFTLRHDERAAALLHLLHNVIPADQQTIIFVSTRHHVEYLNELLTSEGLSPSVVYGTMDQTARKIHIGKFRARKTMLLIVTDVAARGIDIPLLDNVINYDFPPKPKLFVHRVGRAARAGRLGVAYSFVTPDEMPFVLDLHLFLSRPIKPAPSEKELAEQGEGAVQALESLRESGTTVYGSFPQAVVDIQMERVRELTASKSELSNLVKVCVKAYKLYAKTRPPAAAESVNRAKKLPRDGIHTLFRQAVPTGEATLAAFASHLKSFRPKQTVLEEEAASAKGAIHKKAVGVLEVMRRKRAVHENLIETKRRKREGEESLRHEEEVEDAAPVTKVEPSKKRRKVVGTDEPLPKKRAQTDFRDKEFYINAMPLVNRYAEKGLSVNNGDENFEANHMEAAVLDLVPDDREGQTKKRATYHWDKRKKGYIRLQPGEVLTATGKVRTESGAKVTDAQKGLYKKWQQRTKMKVRTAGEEADGGTGGGTSLGGKGGYRGRGRQQGHVPNANARDELKGVDQIRKQRQKKAMKQRAGKEGNQGGKGERGGGFKVNPKGKGKGGFEGKGKRGGAPAKAKGQSGGLSGRKKGKR